MKQQDTTESQMCEGAPNVHTTQDKDKRSSWKQDWAGWSQRRPGGVYDGGLG